MTTGVTQKQCPRCNSVSNRITNERGQIVFKCTGCGQEFPTCLGERWEARASECAGGLDPAYVNPKDGSNKRERCAWYSQCAAKTAAQKLPALVQVRPSKVPSFQPQQQPQQQQQVPVQPPYQQQYQYPQQMMPVPQQPAPMMVPPQQAQVPYMVPMNFAPQGMQMPGYLTVPEPIVPGQHWGKRLGFSVARSMAKAAGHTIANFFDHTPFNPWYPQQ